MFNKKDLRNQKGYTTAEVVISLLIIIATLGVIVMVFANLNLNSKATERKAGATRIATNIMENMSQKYFDGIGEELERVGFNNKKICVVEGEAKIFNTTVPAGYKVEIQQKDIDGVPSSLAKKIELKVKYNVNSSEQSVEFEKEFMREVSRESNSPNFEEKYLEQIIDFYEGSQVYMSTTDLSEVREGYIICPIKFNGQNYSVITDENELKTLWYSYSNKEWAKVVVLPVETYRTKVVSGKITDASIINNDNLYIWIPRFDVIGTEYLSSGAYFKYKDTDYAIQSAYDEEKNEDWQYYYVDYDFEENHTPAEKTNFQVGYVGEWTNYGAITNNWTNAYILNQTQYGPFKLNM